MTNGAHPEESPPTLWVAERALLDAGGGTRIALPTPNATSPIQETIYDYDEIVRLALSIKQSARCLGVHPSSVLQRLRQRTLYVRQRRDELVLATFLFAFDGKEVPGLARVFLRLREHLHPIELRSWLSLPDYDLRIGDRIINALKWLRSGGRLGVVAALGDRP